MKVLLNPEYGHRIMCYEHTNELQQDASTR